MHIGIVAPVLAAHDSFLSPPFVAPLVEGFIRAGLSVSLYGFSREIAAIGQRVDGELLWIGVLHRKRVAVAMADGFAEERALLVPLILKNPPDILHAHWTQFGHALAALDTGLPCVVTVHDAALECARLNAGLRLIDWFCNWRQIQMTREVLHRAQHVIAASPFVADYIRRVFQYQGEVRVIPNAVPAGDEVTVSQKINRTRAPSSPLEPSTRCLAPILITIGHWGRLKNVKNLLRAFAPVKAEWPEAELILIGSGLGSGGPAEKWATHRDLEVGIQFRGSLPHQNVLQVLKEEADILVHPSRSEGFGMTLAEALANGVSVIANQVGSLPWVLDEGKAGLLVDAESPNELTDSMIRMVRDAKMRKEMTLYGYQMVRRRFDPEKIAQQHMEYYRDILQETSH